MKNKDKTKVKIKNVSSNRGLVVNESQVGEPIEVMIERRLSNNESMGEEAPIIFNEMKDGVQPGYNIKTDRFEVALDGFNAIEKSRIAKTDDKPNLKVVKDDEEPNTEVG